MKGNTLRLQILGKLFRSKSRYKIHKTKTPAQGIIDHGQGAISRVHGADEMKVCWNCKGFSRSVIMGKIRKWILKLVLREIAENGVIIGDYNIEMVDGTLTIWKV